MFSESGHVALLGFVKSLNVPINMFNCLNIRNRIRIFSVLTGFPSPRDVQLQQKFNVLFLSPLQVMPAMQVWGQVKVRVKKTMTRTGRRIKRNVAYFQKWQQIS